MAQLKLTASPRPPFGFRILIEKGALPFWEGMGDIDYLCGSCGATLTEKNMKEWPYYEILFRCPNCESYNHLRK